ncbi:tetratricopeptide repeat protein [Mesorhizobium sp. LHD-90]|uniref:tetratricopeptide repeat protein n=1 Tax=Mesorhizobium sp. LHD-90 TaxID=3071414 RepID=UPI0027E0724F|nr:tetratricopeptide repeat protein [Mesorhizobium sp. LHD-90]MDQ6433983.1 tetratricopeptide repeat protein [Mesorhizobium sp. LHD-90]
MAEFASAVDALRAAIDIQSAVASLNGAAADGERMLFRIGINLGDVIIEQSNLFGDGVNVAERLQTLAEPGGICISRSVKEQVRDKLQCAFTDLGVQKLKNILRPVRAFHVVQPGEAAKPARPGKKPFLRNRRSLATVAAILGIFVLLAGGALYLRPWESIGWVRQASGPPTIAVLPFANLSGEPDQEYFSDGVTQDIVAALGRFSNLHVLANNATAKFKGSDANSAELKEKLGARYVVVGSVRRSEDRIRISVDLTDTDKNLHLWSRQFERKLTDIFALQDDITREITGSLAIKLSSLERDRAFAKETEHLDAYDYFLRGRARLADSERSALMEARAMFEKAVALDPHYGAALEALGQTYQIEATQGWTEFRGEALGRAEAHVREALGLSPELAEAHQTLAFTFLARGEYERAIAETRRAIEINPSDAYGYASLGAMLMWSGDAEGAIAAMERAKIFDPTLHWDSLHVLGFAYYLAGRHHDAVAILEPLTGGNPERYIVYLGLAAAYAELGRTDDAERAAKEVKRLSPFFKTAPFVGQWRDSKSRELLAHGLKLAGLE